MPVKKTSRTHYASGKVQSGDVEIFYEDRGPKNKPAIILIMGLASQMIRWPEDFVRGLSEKGFRVIRIDNRDIGYSTHLDHLKVKHLPFKFIQNQLGLKVEAPYTLHDMSQDVIAVMDALKIKKAHIAGTSMGGMICQLTAAKYPNRILSLTSLISSTNARDLPKADFKILWNIGMGQSNTKKEYIERGVKMFTMIGSQGKLRLDPPSLRENVRQHYERGISASGVLRQVLAILATGSLREEVKKIKVPTLVIHGSDDRLIPLACGIDSAKNISGSIMKVFKGMAHDLPAEYRQEMVNLISMNAKRKLRVD